MSGREKNNGTPFFYSPTSLPRSVQRVTAHNFGDKQTRRAHTAPLIYKHRQMFFAVYRCVVQCKSLQLWKLNGSLKFKSARSETGSHHIALSPTARRVFRSRLPEKVIIISTPACTKKSRKSYVYLRMWGKKMTKNDKKKPASYKVCCVLRSCEIHTSFPRKQAKLARLRHPFTFSAVLSLK